MCLLYLFPCSVFLFVWNDGVCLWSLSYIIFSSHLGYLQRVIASCKCWSSVPNSSVVEQTVLAIYVSVMRLYLAAMWWWLSNYEYWSVYLASEYFHVKCTLWYWCYYGVQEGHCAIWPIVLYCKLVFCKNLSSCFVSCITRVLSTYLFYSGDGLSTVLRALFLKSFS